MSLLKWPRISITHLSYKEMIRLTIKVSRIFGKKTINNMNSVNINYFYLGKKSYEILIVPNQIYRQNLSKFLIFFL